MSGPQDPESTPLPGAQRLLPLVGAYNFRDLGGYGAAGDMVTRWGRLYRSDTLHELTEEDLGVLGQIGLRSVIDLRTAAEVARDGPGPWPGTDVVYRHLSVLPEEASESTAAPPAEAGIGARYLWYLEVGGSVLAEAIELLAARESYPVVFHCMAGKDRTGVLAALVLELCGVERRAIVADYVATEERLELIVDRLRRHPYHGPRLEGVPRSALSVEASTMEDFLSGLDRRYGGAARWATGAGVTDESLERLRALVLEPSALSRS